MDNMYNVYENEDDSSDIKYESIDWLITNQFNKAVHFWSISNWEFFS